MRAHKFNNIEKGYLLIIDKFLNQSMTEVLYNEWLPIRSSESSKHWAFNDIFDAYESKIEQVIGPENFDSVKDKIEAIRNKSFRITREEDKSMEEKMTDLHKVMKKVVSELEKVNSSLLLQSKGKEKNLTPPNSSINKLIEKFCHLKKFNVKFLFEMDVVLKQPQRPEHLDLNELTQLQEVSPPNYENDSHLSSESNNLSLLQESSTDNKLLKNIEHHNDSDQITIFHESTNNISQIKKPEAISNQNRPTAIIIPKESINGNKKESIEPLKDAAKPLFKSRKTNKKAKIIKKKSHSIPKPIQKPRKDISENFDYCSLCQGEGELQLCDECPRSYHFKCLKEFKSFMKKSYNYGTQLPSYWKCPSCKKKKFNLKHSNLPRKLLSLQQKLERYDLVAYLTKEPEFYLHFSHGRSILLDYLKNIPEAVYLKDWEAVEFSTLLSHGAVMYLKKVSWLIKMVKVMKPPDPIMHSCACAIWKLLNNSYFIHLEQHFEENVKLEFLREKVFVTENVDKVLLKDRKAKVLKYPSTPYRFAKLAKKEGFSFPDENEISIAQKGQMYRFYV